MIGQLLMAASIAVSYLAHRQDVHQNAKLVARQTSCIVRHLHTCPKPKQVYIIPSQFPDTEQGQPVFIDENTNIAKK